MSILGSRTLVRTRGDVMSDRPFELAWTPEGMVARVRLRGSSVLSSPMLNRGTAFTLAEREALGLTGLLPGGVSTIEGQLRRVYRSEERRVGSGGRRGGWWLEEQAELMGG